MPFFEAYESKDPGDGVDLRDESDSPANVGLRIGNSRTGIAVGHCTACRDDLELVDIPEDFTMEIKGDEYALPTHYFVAVCPSYVRWNSNYDDTKQAALALIRQHWDEDLLREPFEQLDVSPALEERVDELEKQVARLQNQLEEQED